jgi:hypothetical protein
VYLIDLDQDREECRAVVNTVRDLRDPENVENFLTS